jgi:SAM-dependent methyltransferase
MDLQKHWEHVYQSRHSDEVSWFQPEATLSLELIQRAAPSHDSYIVDIGAGASTLVDGLIAAGYENVTLLDLSHTALEETKRRLGSRARKVVWREADVLSARFEASVFDVWHDRAVFHFRLIPQIGLVTLIRSNVRFVRAGMQSSQHLRKTDQRIAADSTSRAILPMNCIANSV